MLQYTIPRRSLVTSLLVCGLLATPASGMAPRRDGLRSLIAHWDAACLIGRRYLAIAPEDRSASALCRALFGGPLPSGGGAAAVSHLRGIVEVRRREDFSRGDTVLIDGWLLARSEARLCALASLI
ncbi:MAG: hypothetical protein KIT25_18355 [Enhydrobacter sp.]|nr:MAG: hypothetical protein KIT25_18355 [Enhydrobacter sp.]